MTSPPNLSKAAASALQKDAEAGSPPRADTRAATIAAMAGALRRRKKQKRTRFVAITSSLAVAAVIVLAMGGRAVLRGRDATSGRPADATSSLPSAPPMVAASFVRGTPMLIRGEEHVVIADGALLRAGDHVSVQPGSRMTIGFAQGSHVAIDDQAELDMTAAGPSTAFELKSGSVRADVAKLLSGERFMIRTADVEVEVHGTSFEVTRVDDSDRSNCNKKTRVRVREGVVTVRSAGHETLVRAGEVWPICSETPTVVATSTNALAPTTSARPSDLAAQNDLFEAAISKKRVGDTRGAVTAFEDLLTRYPQSHLAQSARAERMKLLRTVDRDRARAAAQDYLKRYPTGFARRDAELIVEEK